MIRASNQLSPKSKVVDLVSLYNFYFGQISCSNVKFGVLGGQTLIKIISNEFHSVTVFSSEVVRAPIPRPRVVAGDATRRPSANLALRARAPVLIPTEPCPFSSTLLLPRARNEWKTSLSSSLWSIPAPVTPREQSRGALSPSLSLYFADGWGPWL